MIMYQTESPI